MSIRRKTKGSPLSRILPWTLLALALIFVGGFIAFRIWFFGYLKSDAFRHLIGGLTSNQIKADGEYLPFSFNDSAIYSDGYKAQGTAQASFSDLRAEQIRAQINLGGLWKHAWQIDEIDIQHIEVALGHAAEGAGPSPAPAPEAVPQESYAVPSMPKFKWLPDHVDLRKVIIHETDLKWGGGTPHAGAINDAALTITPDGDAWIIACDSGSIVQQGQPKLAIQQADLRYQRPTLFITDADLRYNADSNIELSGEINFEKEFDVRAKLNNIPITPLLRPDWRAKLRGNLSGNVHINSALPIAGGPDVDGKLSLAQGQLEALPVLDKIAAFTSTERFRRISLTRVTANFSRTDSLLKVTSLLAESEGLIRVEGDFTVQNGMIDGTFQVGITTSSIMMLPAALQTQVFSSSHGGYVWTTMHLTGPVDHPSEDLSTRLLAATPGAIIDTARDAAKGVIDNVPGAGTVIDEGKKAIDTVVSPLFGN